MSDTKDNKPQKFHPGFKGVDAMNGRTLDEAKEYRKEVFEAVCSMIGRGYTYQMKVDALVTRFKVSARQAKNYIKETREEIQKRKQDNYAKEYDEVLIKLDTLYREMFASGNLQGAAKVLDQLIKLRGYEAPKTLAIKQDIEVKNDLSHMSEADLLELQSLLNKGKQE